MYICHSLSSMNYHINKSNENGNFTTWPGIKNLNFKTLLGTTTAAELGHLDQERKNLRSIKDNHDDDDFFPAVVKNKEYELYATIEPARPKEKTYSDQMGRFPYKYT